MREYKYVVYLMRQTAPDDFEWEPDSAFEYMVDAMKYVSEFEAAQIRMVMLPEEWDQKEFIVFEK